MGRAFIAYFFATVVWSLTGGLVFAVLGHPWVLIVPLIPLVLMLFGLIVCLIAQIAAPSQPE